jgi:citrate lyase subunit beta/citryl-CoA lyase
MDKALRSGADALIFDLEDAVPPAELPRARAMVRAFVAEHGNGPPMMFARVGMAGTPEMAQDIAELVRPGLTGVFLPMVRDVAEVERADALISAAERDNGIAVGTTILVPLLETASALRMSYEIATCSERIAYMGSGVSRQGDIARALGYQWTPEGLETLYYRSKALLDVRAAGIAYPVTGIWGDVADLVGLRRFAEQSRGLGYDGMMAIHPSHVETINDMFTPTQAQIAAWQQVIEVLDAAHARGQGTATLEGRVIDYAHVKTAKQGIALAGQLGLIN